MTYLITGVTGELGKHILDNLSTTVPISEIAVLVRTQAKGQPFADAGYEVRIGDYSDKAQLLTAFSDIETLMFISGTPGQVISRDQQHQTVIEAAVAAQVKQIVYTSIANAAHSHSVLAPDHVVTETLIKQSGLRYKILRNNWYLENELGIFTDALNGKGFNYAGGDGKIGWALKKDYAKAATQALLQPFDQNHIYELSAPLLSYSDLHQALQTATGKTFPENSLTLYDYQAVLKQAGLPDDVIQIVSAIQADIAKGELAVTSSDFETLLGHQPTPIVTAIQELLA